MSALEASATVRRLRDHLATLPGDFGCRYLARERDGVEASLLIDLDLVRPIATRVPTCAFHKCPRCGTCPWEELFHSEATGGKAGVKYRRTADGDAVAGGSLSVIGDRIADLPLATAVIAALDNGPRSLFAVQWGLVESAREAIRAGVNTERVAPDRPALLSVLRLLADLGVVALREDGTVERAGTNGICPSLQ